MYRNIPVYKGITGLALIRSLIIERFMKCGIHYQQNHKSKNQNAAPNLQLALHAF